MRQKLIYVACGEGFTSAVIVKEAPRSWLVQRRFRDGKGQIYLERPRRIWKHDLGNIVWLTKTAAKDHQQKLRRFAWVAA